MDATEKELSHAQKAMAYDLVRLLEKDEDKTYTVKELKDMIETYVTGQDS